MLHDSGDIRQRRLANERVSNAGSTPNHRRNVLSSARLVRSSRLPLDSQDDRRQGHIIYLNV